MGAWEVTVVEGRGRGSSWEGGREATEHGPLLVLLKRVWAAGKVRMERNWGGMGRGVHGRRRRMQLICEVNDAREFNAAHR